MSRIYSPGDAYTGIFTTSDPTTGNAANADSTPTAKLLRNGVHDAAVTVTVANVETGVYSLSCTIPGSYANGDRLAFLVAATVGGIASKASVDSLRLDDAVADAVAAGLAAADVASDAQQAGEPVTLPTTPPDGYGGTGTLYGEAGSVDFTYTVYDTDQTTPLPGVSVFVSADEDGAERSQAKLTDSLGRVTFRLNPGTVYFWRFRADRLFANPDSEDVS